MKNLYQVFSKNRYNKRLIKRNLILDKLRGKKFFTNDDLNSILSYLGLPEHDEYNGPMPTVMDLTEASFTATDLRKKINMLKGISGVNLIVASSILAFQDPYRYAGVSFPVWNFLSRDTKSNIKKIKVDRDFNRDFSVNDYQAYLDIIKSLCNEHGMRPVDVQFALEMMAEEDRR